MPLHLLFCIASIITPNPPLKQPLFSLQIQKSCTFILTFVTCGVGKKKKKKKHYIQSLPKFHNSLKNIFHGKKNWFRQSPFLSVSFLVIEALVFVYIHCGYMYVCCNFILLCSIYYYT